MVYNPKLNGVLNDNKASEGAYIYGDMEAQGEILSQKDKYPVEKQLRKISECQI